MGWSVIDGNQGSLAASCGWERRCEIWWQGLITFFSDSKRLFGLNFPSNPAVKRSWMFSQSLLSLLHNQIWVDCIMVMANCLCDEVSQRSLKSQCSPGCWCLKFHRLTVSAVHVDSTADTEKQWDDSDTIRWRWRRTVLFWVGVDRGLKVSDSKIKDSTSSKFTLLVCLTQDSSGTSLPLSVRMQSENKSHSLSTHEWAASTSVCACTRMCGACVAFVLALQCDFWQ